MDIPHNAPVLVDLRRARLSADAVTLDGRVFRSAFGYDQLQKLAHGCARLLADGIGYHLGLGSVEHGPVRRNRLLEQIGLHQPSAVDHRARRRNQLNRSDGHALSKADARQIHILDGLYGY